MQDKPTTHRDTAQRNDQRSNTDRAALKRRRLAIAGLITAAIVALLIVISGVIPWGHLSMYMAIGIVVLAVALLLHARNRLWERLYEYADDHHDTPDDPAPTQEPQERSQRTCETPRES